MMKIERKTRRKTRSLVSPALLCHVPHYLVIGGRTTFSVASEDHDSVAETGGEELEKQFVGIPLELTLGLFLSSPPLSPEGGND